MRRGGGEEATRTMIEVDWSKVDARIERVLPAVPGWCTLEKAKRMARLVVEERAPLSVELGVFGGRSLLALAFGAELVGGARVDGVDPYTVAAAVEGSNARENELWWSRLEYDQIHRDAVALLTAEGVGHVAYLRRMTSAEAAHLYAADSIGVLHQDSNHSHEVSCAEVMTWRGKVRPGGIWIQDDTDWATMRASQEMLAEAGFACLEDHGAWKVWRKPSGEARP